MNGRQRVSQSKLYITFSVLLILRQNVYQENIFMILFFFLQNRDDKLTFDEFLEGSKKDPTIIQALTLYDMAQPQGQG